MLIGNYLLYFYCLAIFSAIPFPFSFFLSPRERHQQYNGGGRKRKEKGTKLLEKGGKEGLGWMVV